MKVFFYFFLASLLVVCSPSHSAGHQPVSSSCDPEYFESEDREKDSPDSYESPKEREEKILELIDRDNRITIAEMATEMSLSRTTIDKMLAGLKQEGRLARIGTYNGYWQILKKEGGGGGEGNSLDSYESPEQIKEEVLKLIAGDNKITTAQMAHKMNFAVDNILAALKREGRLARIGANPGGYWQILQEGDSPDSYESSEERKEKLLKLIAENAGIAVAEIAKAMNLSKSTINRIIAGLKLEGRLTRVGTTMSGYWQILKEGDQPDDPLEKRQKKLLELIAENGGITVAEMATAMNLSQPTISRIIAGLKLEGRLTRVGRYRGYWQILKEGDQPDDPLEQKKEKILKLIAENDRITGVEMAKEMNLSESTISRVIAELRREGRLTRVGTSRNGYWVVLENRNEGENADQS